MFSMVCRKQVHLRHKNGHRIFFGRFNLKKHENFARDFSKFLKRCCEDKTLTGGYHHCCSREIFQKFELPPHEPLVPICKQLPNYNKEDPIVVKVYTDFCRDVRKRISEMLPYLDKKLVEIGLNSGEEDCATWSSSFTSVSDAIEFLHYHYDDWVVLAEFVSILGTEGIMTCFLTHFFKGTSRKDFPGDQTSELQGGTFNNPSLCHSEHDTAVGDHSARSQINQSVANVFDSSFANLEDCRINPLDLPPISSEDMPDMMSRSAAEMYLFEHFLDDHWLILAEIVKSGMDTVSLLFEDSSFEQDYQAGSHKEASVTFQEGKFGYVSSEHRQNYATCGDLAGLTSSINRGCAEQACSNRSYEFISESSLGVASLEPCGTSPLSWPPITSEFEILLDRDLGSGLGEKRRLVTDEPVEFEK
jgi:hypothetical protein